VRVGEPEVAGTTERGRLLLGLRTEEEEEASSSSRRLALAVKSCRTVTRQPRNKEQGIRLVGGDKEHRPYLAGDLTPLVSLVLEWSLPGELHYVGKHGAVLSLLCSFLVLLALGMRVHSIQPNEHENNHVHVIPPTPFMPSRLYTTSFLPVR